jgi:hypothetical protein
MVRYKTAEGRAAENEALVHAVFDELRSRTPVGLEYASYRLADGVTFVHIATHHAAGDDPLTALPAFKAFQRDIRSRCVEAPVVTELAPIDAYGRLEARA